MAKPIIMPKTGMAMEEGTLIKWLKNEGDTVDKGEAVAEIETDKSVMELEADYDGTILKILSDEGAVVPVTEVIAWIGEAGEKIPEKSDDAADEEKNEEPVKKVISSESRMTDKTCRIKATPAARKAAEEKGIELNNIEGTGKWGEILKKDVTAVSLKSTPLAKKIMEANNISPGDISGSGYSGKIFARDLDTGSRGNSLEKVSDEFNSHMPLTGIQKITGKRMLESHLTIPPVTQNIKADLTDLLTARSELNRRLNMKLSVNDFILFAVVKALKKYPKLNSVFNNTELILKDSVNLGVAVATERGLVVPVIREAEKYSLTELSACAKNIAGKGRDGKLSPDEMSGGSFTVSNLGMFGITSFTPIINPPEAGILGVCAIEDSLKLKENGEVEIRKVMQLCLTYDHRIVDGAEAAVFMKHLKDYLELPLMML